MATGTTVGRFAPSPTGPLHFGSLVAAVGSYLFAKHEGGEWLVRIEDLDTPRVVAGAAEEILESLQRYGLRWDGEVVWQSKRTALYEEAMDQLRAQGMVYPCGCSRAELLRAPSAPASSDPVDRDGRIYPGTCRNGLPAGKTERAIRFRVPDEVIAFDDLVVGHVEENVAAGTGDFVVRRADGLFAYQLAVVVDDALQGVNQVVRGADLLDSTARQIALQRALGYDMPQYAHLPLILNGEGTKLGKRDGALPLPQLNSDRVQETLRSALQVLGCSEVSGGQPEKLLANAVVSFQPSKVRGGTVRFSLK